MSQMPEFESNEMTAYGIFNINLHLVLTVNHIFLHISYYNNDTKIICMLLGYLLLKYNKIHVMYNIIMNNCNNLFFKHKNYFIFYNQNRMVFYSLQNLILLFSGLITLIQMKDHPFISRLSKVVMTHVKNNFSKNFTRA